MTEWVVYILIFILGMVVGGAVTGVFVVKMISKLLPEGITVMDLVKGEVDVGDVMMKQGMEMLETALGGEKENEEIKEE